MNKAEIQNLVKELSAYDSNYDNYIMTEQDISILADELLAKINYTRCCEELKELDDNNFDDWLIVNGYTVYKDHYMKGDQVFFESELIQKYNNEVMDF
jgi:hypothetical protein